MKIKDLLSNVLQNAELMVANEPFTFSGKATIELEGGEARYWLFSSNGGMISVSPDDEELTYFRMLDEEVEPENETVGYAGKDFEFSYEDVGSVTSVEGDAQIESDERYAFADYEADDGETIRLVHNENSGNKLVFIGSLVGEDDVVLVE